MILVVDPKNNRVYGMVHGGWVKDREAVGLTVRSMPMAFYDDPQSARDNVKVQW
jgi:hypothetical protein